mgnify:CR=1 FL=1
MRLRKECWGVTSGDLRSDHFLARSKTGDPCKCLRLLADSEAGVKCGLKLQDGETSLVFLCSGEEGVK